MLLHCSCIIYLFMVEILEGKNYLTHGKYYLTLSLLLSLCINILVFPKAEKQRIVSSYTITGFMHFYHKDHLFPWLRIQLPLLLLYSLSFSFSFY